MVLGIAGAPQLWFCTDITFVGDFIFMSNELEGSAQEGQQH
jgi:hypothetical protein